MKIFVTGGSGFVGGHVIERLARGGHEIVAMARSEASARTVERYGAVAMPSALGEVEGERLRGVDAIVHCAAHVEEWGAREAFWRINVEGTRQLLAAAKVGGVGRFVFVGTEAVLFNGGDLVEVDESAPYAAPQRFLYSETKAEAERSVLAANSSALTTISVRPRFVWGPRDASVLPAIVRMANTGAWRFIGGGHATTSTAHVFNVVHAIELALTRGVGGQSYFVADEGTRTMRSFLTALAQTQGITLPDRSMPKWLARAAAAALETVWAGLRLKTAPPLTRLAAAMMSSTVTVRIEKARRDLGYAPVISVEEGLAALGTSDP